MKKALKKIYFEGELYVCFILFVVMTAMLTYQVILRFIFNAANTWSEELARYMFIYIVFLASSAAILEKRHIKIEACENLFPGITKKISEALGELIWTIFSLALGILSVLYIKDQVIDMKIISIGLGGPMWPWWMAVPLGNFLIFIRLTIGLIEKWIIKRPLVAKDENTLDLREEADKIMEGEVNA